jgi:hypothetical protein
VDSVARFHVPNVEDIRPGGHCQVPAVGRHVHGQNVSAAPLAVILVVHVEGPQHLAGVPIDGDDDGREIKGRQVTDTVHENAAVAGVREQTNEAPLGKMRNFHTS